MKLHLNAEYRTSLFWKFEGAAFIDAGNIWTLRNYQDQPGGQFKKTIREYQYSHNLSFHNTYIPGEEMQIDFAGDALWPVSYTHLDVYKRQL